MSLSNGYRVEVDGDYADCPEDKLMDYICMANNLEGRDAYLIYGVDNDGKIIGIENTSYKRCNTKEINEFLRNKPFAGGYIPSISVDVLLLVLFNKKLQSNQGKNE